MNKRQRKKACVRCPQCDGRGFFGSWIRLGGSPIHLSRACQVCGERGYLSQVQTERHHKNCRKSPLAK